MRSLPSLCRAASGSLGFALLVLSACGEPTPALDSVGTGGSDASGGRAAGGAPTGGTGGANPPATGGAAGSGVGGSASGGTGMGTGGAAAGSGGASSGAGGTGTSAGGAGMNGGGTGAGRGGTNAAGSGPSSGGMAGVGAGGSGPQGGTSGGGSGGTAGDGPIGPGLTDPSTFTPVTCAITPDVTTASKIPTVGIATFTTDLAGAERAVIQFGKTAEYTLEAPVDWAAAEHETLLLGMPANTDVHYRVIVIQGTNACVGADATYRTGAPPSGAPANQTPTKGTSTAEVAPGFIIAESGNFAYIVNKQGEVVWAYRFPVSLTRALMSWDGKYMLARDLGPFNAGTGGNLYRVAMDGTEEMKLSVSGGHHHDFTVTPTGIAYAGKQAAGQCDTLYTANPDGSNSQPLVNLEVVFGKFDVGPGGASMEECHVNAIRYYADTDSYSLSDREKDAIAFISGSGEVLGSIGATPNASTPNHAEAEGADSTSNSTWRVQHGHDLYEPNKIVLFANGPFQGGQSKILHYTINGNTATLDWQYSAMGNSPTLSDAQRLPNGNFLATNSQSGAVHEIDPTQKLVQSFASLCRGGYASHRSTLYGRPPGR